MTLKVIPGANLKEVLGPRFEEKQDYFECHDEIFGEFIAVNKHTRIISHYGFTGMVSDLVDTGYVVAEFDGGPIYESETQS